MIKFPPSGSIDELPTDILNEFLDKINHIKRENSWEKFKSTGHIVYTDSGLELYYIDGDIVGIKKLDPDNFLIYNIPFNENK